jgi:hypothetical protein
VLYGEGRWKLPDAALSTKLALEPARAEMKAYIRGDPLPYSPRVTKVFRAGYTATYQPHPPAYHPDEPTLL